MSVVEPGTGGAGLVQRVKDLLLKPKETWDVIEAEPATVADLYKSWVIPLAAIPAVCALVGSVVFGVGGFGFNYKPPLFSAVAGAVVGYAVTLAGVYIGALIVDALAPTFNGSRNQVQAFKVVAYSSTAAWVAGVFQILPMLAILALIGAIYSFYLLYLGLPRLMKTPEEKSLPYVAVIVVVGIVIGLVASAVTVPLMAMGRPGPFAQHGGTVQLPGGPSVDVGRLEEASKKLEQAASGSGAVKASDPELLKAFLPPSIGGYGRSAISVSSAEAGSMTGSTVEGTYTKGDAKITVSIIDLGAAGALAGMAGALNLKSSTESNGKYEKVGKVDGRTTMEEYDSGSGQGQYSVLAGDRFMIQAEGHGAPVADLKAAVAAVGPARLENLAKAG